MANKKAGSRGRSLVGKPAAEISQGQDCAFCYTGPVWRMLKPSIGDK